MAAVASLWTHLPAKKIRHGSMQVDDSPSSNLRCFHHCAPASFSGQPTGELDFICSRTHGRVYIRQSNVVRALKYRKIFDASYVDEEPIKSPFTEKDSIKLSRGQGINAQEICPPILDTLCAENGGQTQELNESQKHSYEQNDIAARLPELEGMLALLKGQLAKEGKSARKGPGNVYLIGTGPGDPDLLTLKAVKLMQTADLVLYDRLVSTDILEMVHPEAKLLYVGKTSGYHSRTQDEIHELLLSFAEVGATVLRLKGGDPLVFGRGGEEMDFLQEQGIRVTIIPGITAASGIAAELGIPLTHRGIANSVRFLTGHSRKGGKDPLHVAEHAADPDSTLVVYMGLATLPALAAKLMDNGLTPETPAAAIERGTTAQQRTVFAPLEDLAAEVSLMQLVSPTLIFIGQVVALSPYWPFGRSMTTDNLAIHQEPRDRRLRNPDPSLPSQRIQ